MLGEEFYHKNRMSRVTATCLDLQEIGYPVPLPTFPMPRSSGNTFRLPSTFC